jgi:glutamate-1-semialdehyde aminotransferase
LVAKWAIPRLQALAKSSSLAKPSLLVTSGLLHLEPISDLFSLSLVKTAQRNLVQSLHKVYNSQGIHVGLVLVGGMVSTEAKVLNPTNIANVTWDFFDQDSAKGELEVTMLEAGC